MDYLEDYLSLVQSFKNYYSPVMEISLEVRNISDSIKECSIEGNLSTVEKLPIQKNPKPESKEVSKKGSTLLGLADNPLYASIKKALPQHIFYAYPPIGISPTKKLPSHELPNIPFFFYKEIPFNEKLSTNLIAAIQGKFGVSCALIDAREIEESNLWRSVISMTHLRSIIVYDTWIANSPHGRCWYRAETNTNNCFLRTIPLIVLSSETDWYLNIENKKVLWNQLCRILKKPFRKNSMIR